MLSSATSVAGQDSGQQNLRTFTIEKPPELVRQERAADQSSRVPLTRPPEHDVLRTTVGLGFVEGADWGNEILAGGSFKGIQIQFDSLVTHGSSGFLFDRGSVSLFDPDRHWRVEAGDVFSELRGASRGGRFSWQARGWRPAISVYSPRPGTSNRTTVVSYRDQIQVGEHALLDAEVASDKSYLMRTQLAGSRFDVEASYRSGRNPARSEDRSISGGLRVWRNAGFTVAVFRSRQGELRSDSRIVAVRLPFSRFFDLTLERAFNSSNDIVVTTTAAMASLSAGGVRLFHRHQFGEYDYLRPGFSGSVERQQTQSMASYLPTHRLNLTLQLATQRTDAGRMQSWEELQATMKLTRSTTLQTVTAVPDFTNAKKFRANVRQQLRGRFALQAEYGRLSAYQAVPYALERSRFKVMLFKTWDVATPARGAEVQGRVLDQTGRAVVGARVRLGSYTAETDRNGRYLFRYVPRGEYTLSLDSHFLPADYAWDGRDVRLTLTWSSRIVLDLLVAPLNAVHGRVYEDRNGNGRFDPDEAVGGVPVLLDEQVTATDHTGAYSFYNVWPGNHVVHLDTEKLPSDFEVAGPLSLNVTLEDTQPVTRADFHLKPKAKPILWQKVVSK